MLILRKVHIYFKKWCNTLIWMIFYKEKKNKNGIDWWWWLWRLQRWPTAVQCTDVVLDHLPMSPQKAWVHCISLHFLLFIVYTARLEKKTSQPFFPDSFIMILITRNWFTFIVIIIILYHKYINIAYTQLMHLCIYKQF